MPTYTASASIEIKAPLSEVWRALTEPELVKKYFFGTDLVTDWQVGSPIYFRGEWEGKKYEDKGTVLAYEIEDSLSFNYWSGFSGLADQPELYQVITYDVSEKNDGVIVTITQSNVDTQERADHSAKNWQQVLEGMKSLLESSPLMK